MASGLIRPLPDSVREAMGYSAKREEIKDFGPKTRAVTPLAYIRQQPPSASSRIFSFGEIATVLNGASASPADALELRIQQFVALIRGGLDGSSLPWRRPPAKWPRRRNRHRKIRVRRRCAQMPEQTPRPSVLTGSSAQIRAQGAREGDQDTARYRS
jgi:hypothetical protein